MNTSLEERVEALELEVEQLSERIARFEPRPGRAAQPAQAMAHVKFRTPAPKPDDEEAPAPALERVSGSEPRTSSAAPRAAKPLELEELLGGRLLALVGGVAVLLGIAFLVALAIERGWIGETARVGLAFAGSAALLGAGVWLYERTGRTQAALAMVGTAVAGLYLALTAGSVLYELVPVAAALVCAFAIGALATALAVRWDTRTVAGLGIGGTLLAPVLGDSLTTGGMGFLAIASAAAAGVLVWRRWRWLSIGAFAITASQVAVWVADGPADAELVFFLTVFAALNLAVALGYALRDHGAKLEPSSALLALFGATVFGALGFAELPHGVGQASGGVWLAALAAAHGLLGVVVLRSNASDEIGLVLVGVFVTLANIAFGVLAEGPTLAVGWAASALIAVGVARRYRGRAQLVQLTLGSQLALAVGHVLLLDAPPSLLEQGANGGADAAAAVAAIAVAAFACARLVVDEKELGLRAGLDVLSLAALAYVTALSLDGLPLVLAWVGAATALAGAARRFDDRVAGLGAVGFLALATAHVLTVEAPPNGLVYGIDGLFVGAAAIALVAAGAAWSARIDPTLAAEERAVLGGLGAAALLYLASVAIVTPFQPGSGALDTGLGMDIRQQGQVLLSAFWGACGFVALWLGLRHDARLVRLGGLGLLCLAVAKVFFYDLSTLASIYRVASFVGLGLLLLTAAFSYQRMRAPR